MRVFIAVDVDETNKTAVIKLQGRISREAAVEKRDATWVKPEAMHLTLKFLGEIDDKRVVEVCNIVKEVSSKHKSFELDIENVGSFGGRSARVLWVGTGAGSDNLCGLAEDIEKKLAAVGFGKERRKFTGHLTLCRVKNSKAGVRLAQTAEGYKDFKFGSAFIDAVTIYQSQLKPTGPEYIVLGSYKLI